MILVKNWLKQIKEYHAKRDYILRQPNSYQVDNKTVKKAHQLGFTTDEWTIFGLDKNNPNDYLCEYERVRYGQSISKLRTILDNKIIASLLIGQFAKNNHIFAFKTNGIYTTLSHGFQQEQIIDRIKELHHLVFKVETGSVGGKGVRLLEYFNDTFFINKKASSSEEINQLLTGNQHYLLEEFCQQSKFEMELFPDAVNTLRIVTAMHKDGTFEILAAMHRMGAVAKTCVDNAGPGGLFSHIDIETGEMSSAESYSPKLWTDENGNRRFFSKHPVTGFQLEGTKIPGWENIKSEIISLHKKMIFTGLKLIAWDIALTDNGPVVIEANSSCGLHFLQTRHGQRNGKVGLWLKEWNMIQ